MKHAPVIVGITATMLLTACGGQAQDNAWFEENCPVQISDVREHFEQGGPTGKVVTTAMTQGPMNPPAGLDDSQHARIGLYTNDEPSGSMELEREINADDMFCLELGIKDAERRLTVDTRQHEIEGDLHGDVYEADFTLLRSPEYPEGIWVGLPASDLPRGIEITENMPERCELQWWPTEDIDYGNAAKAPQDIAGLISTQEDCLAIETIF